MYRTGIGSTKVRANLAKLTVFAQKCINQFIKVPNKG